MNGLPRKILVNRVTVTFGTIIVLVTGWNLYILGHDDGRLSGTVVDLDGNPVAGATAVISELSLINRNIIDTAMTDADGRFQFLAHDHHALVLQAQKDGIGNSKRHELRLYFRNQNLDLDELIVLDPDIKQGPQLSRQSGEN